MNDCYFPLCIFLFSFFKISELNIYQMLLLKCLVFLSSPNVKLLIAVPLRRDFYY